jgi:hypothetical protein
MFSKKYYIIGVIACYGLVLLLFSLSKEEETNRDSDYSEDHPQIRFCCDNTTLCKDDFIRENFKAEFYASRNRNSSVAFLILHGSPTCWTLLDLGTKNRMFNFVSFAFLDLYCVNIHDSFRGEVLKLKDLEQH